MRVIFFLLFIFYSTVPCNAETALWEVRRGGSVVYIGGTVHLLSSSDYPLPKEYDAAYRKSDVVIFESDIGKMSDPAFQQKMLMAASYRDERTLKSVLNSETYEALEAYCSARGFPLESLLNFKPGMVSMTLTMLELQRLGMADIGVDRFFYTKAEQDGKKIKGLESLEKQIEFVAQMGEGRENELIMKTIRDAAEIPKLIGDMKAAWRSGNTTELEALTVTPMKTDYPKLYHLLLVSRNRAWLPQIRDYFHTPEVELVLVGSAHLLGNEGLLSRLNDQGYQVKQFKISP